MIVFINYKLLIFLSCFYSASSGSGYSSDSSSAPTSLSGSPKKPNGFENTRVKPRQNKISEEVNKSFSFIDQFLKKIESISLPSGRSFMNPLMIPTIDMLLSNLRAAIMKLITSNSKSGGLAECFECIALEVLAKDLPNPPRSPGGRNCDYLSYKLEKQTQKNYDQVLKAMSLYLRVLFSKKSEEDKESIINSLGPWVYTIQSVDHGVDVLHGSITEKFEQILNFIFLKCKKLSDDLTKNFNENSVWGKISLQYDDFDDQIIKCREISSTDEESCTLKLYSTNETSHFDIECNRSREKFKSNVQSMGMHVLDYHLRNQDRLTEKITNALLEREQIPHLNFELIHQADKCCVFCFLTLNFYEFPTASVV